MSVDVRNCIVTAFGIIHQISGHIVRFFWTTHLQIIVMTAFRNGSLVIFSVIYIIAVRIRWCFWHNNIKCHPPLHLCWKNVEYSVGEGKGNRSTYATLYLCKKKTPIHKCWKVLNIQWHVERAINYFSARNEMWLMQYTFYCCKLPWKYVAMIYHKFTS